MYYAGYFLRKYLTVKRTNAREVRESVLGGYKHTDTLTVSRNPH